MEKLFKLLTNDFNKDVDSMSEFTNEAVLVRLLGALGVLYYLLTAILLAFSQHILLCLSLVFCIGISVGTIVCTYENKTTLGCIIYIVLTLLAAAALSLGIGWKYFFAPIAIAVLMVLYYCIDISLQKKLYVSIGIALYLLAIAILYPYLPQHTEIGPKITVVLLTLNVLFPVMSISVVGYCFYIKFSQSEEKILQYTKKLEQMVSTDPLTTLWNRRAMNEHLDRLVQKYNKHQKDFSIAIMDIDFFKRVNDEYGHGMGDYVLKNLSATLKSHMEGIGHVCRWGGEEFLLSFENMDYDEAVSHMNALRTKVENQTFSFEKTTIHITITGGIVEYNRSSSLDALITKADELLYEGKTTGRNKIVSFQY